MKTYGFALRHIAAPEHCAGYIGLYDTQEEAQEAKTLECRYSRRIANYVIERVMDHAHLKQVQDEIRYGHRYIGLDRVY